MGNSKYEGPGVGNNPFRVIEEKKSCSMIENEVREIESSHFIV